MARSAKRIIGTTVATAAVVAVTGLCVLSIAGPNTVFVRDALWAFVSARLDRTLVYSSLDRERRGGPTVLPPPPPARVRIVSAGL